MRIEYECNSNHEDQAMGNGGASDYKPPPAEPMPIEDDIRARHEAAAQLASRMTGASRNANDLAGASASDEPAITRSQIETGNSFSAQPQPRGPAGRRRSHGGSVGALTRSSVLTG